MIDFNSLRCIYFYGAFIVFFLAWSFGFRAKILKSSWPTVAIENQAWLYKHIYYPYIQEKLLFELWASSIPVFVTEVIIWLNYCFLFLKLQCFRLLCKNWRCTFFTLLFKKRLKILRDSFMRSSCGIFEYIISVLIYMKFVILSIS